MILLSAICNPATIGTPSPPGSDERGQGGGADGDHRRGAEAGHDHRGGEGKAHQPEDLPGPVMPRAVAAGTASGPASRTPV